MTQLAITARDNKNLFSNYYLDNQLKNNLEWKKEEHKAAFSEIKKLYDTEKDFIPTLNEKQLEQRFFGPIFKILNHTVEVNEGTEQGEFPDYAFFPERASLDDAHKKMGNSFYNNAIAIGEVKRWGIELDRFGKDEKDRKRNPSLQIWIYLHDVTPKWGILSNGAKWRLYCKERLRDDYYEVDLPTLIATNDIENFKYFYYFFRREAYLRSTDGTIFLDEVLKGSADYAKVIGDDLKDNVYKAMKKVAEGFFSWSQNGLDIQNEETRKTVQKCTMLLLYRFLFLLYAEGKGLLDLKRPQYQSSYSFYRLKNEVKEKQDGPKEQRYLGVGTALWAHLKDLFRLINQGSESLGIKDKNVLDVPAYNGGLFDPQKNPELEKWVIGDTYLSEAIDLLSRSRADGGKLDFVDYSTLEIRHLGSIYEGLLEYKLQVAEDEMVVNGGEWVKLEEYNKDRKQKKVFSDFGEFDRVRKGQIYLATDKGDRKATGSYYTPDYIVNYIVKNTIEPVVDEKWKDAEANKKSFVDATLSVKVLDPAMGSGHFLVGSIEFLSEKLLLAVKKDIDNGRFSDESHLTSDWARREVVAHCIYGVDLNLMAVELAKVGLWLTTISKEKPLSFLDHRLKQGNSLIGSRLEDLPYYPDINAKKKEKRVKDAAQQTFEVDIEKPFFDKIVKILNSLTDINDDTIENIYKKKDIFEKMMNSPEYQRIKAFANLHTSLYFGVVTTEFNKLPKDGYYKVLWALRKDEEGWRKDTNREWFGKARRLAQEKSFFHWELEFPELFFEGGAPKENPGWDAVVGNPPYIDSEEMTRSWQDERNYCVKIGYNAASGNWDIFCIFIEKGISLVHGKGLFSYIIPNKLLAADYALGTQNIIKNYSLKNLRDYSAVKVFDISVYPIVIVVEKFVPQNNHYVQIEVMEEKSNSNDPVISFENRVDIETFKKLPEGLWSPLVRKNFPIIQKVIKNSESLFRLGEVLGAATVSEAYEFKNVIKEVKEISTHEEYSFFINTGIIDRYDSLWGNVGVTYIKDVYQYPVFKYEDISKISEKRLSEAKKEKIIIAGMTLQLEAFYDKGEYLAGKSTVIILPKTQNNLKFIASCINSKLISFVYRELFGSLSLQGGYLRVGPPQIERIPIRRISFTTPPDHRAAFAAEAKALYSAFLSAPDSQTILEFVSLCLSAAPEESDVVHDLLAYLAERMIEMNKEKNVEVKSFLDFLKGEIGAPIEDLSNKTAIQEYYSHKFQNIIDVLVKNKKKLKAGYDPKSPANYKHLLEWYNSSVGKLKPLMGRIEATDGLIDQIVYKLYGLTEDEIKIVEGSGNMNVKAEVKAS